MIHIEALIFNPFQETTYLLHDGSGDCVVVDAGCYTGHECDHLKEFIAEKGLRPVRLLNTHCHVDHVLGNRFMKEEFGLKTWCHKEEQVYLDGAAEHGMMFGLQIDPLPPAGGYLDEGDQVEFGDSRLNILHLPGHSRGSLGFYDPEKSFVLAGDVLFRAGIGRTDLPGGNYQTLLSSIREKLLPLGDRVMVYPGHGPATTIGLEKLENPFLNGYSL